MMAWRIWRALWMSALTVFSSTLVIADELQSSATPIIIPTISDAITVDGDLSEPAWQQARLFTLDYVTQPYENTEAPVKTEVRVFEDGETLYVGFVAYDPNPENISAFYRDRDQIWGHDLVGIKLDTFNKGRLAYQFFINPLGVQTDSIENEMTGNESDSWNAIWESSGQITATGYVVEVAIPLRAMNFDDSHGHKQFGAEFVRFYPREDYMRLSNIPQDRDNACILCQLGDVSGFERATQGKNLAVIPTMVLGRGEQRAPYAGSEWQKLELEEVGLDIKWGITPQIALQATLNPDFSQVEADDAQLSINNTFSLYFDERRPFFVENADYFSTNQTLVYTRNISAPNAGLKLTGQADKHTFGLFIADDESTQFIVPGNISSDVGRSDSSTTNAALRYRFDVNDDLSIGWLGTVRESDDYQNIVNGVDAKYRLTEQDTVRVQYVISETDYPVDLYRQFCRGECNQAEDYSEIALRTANPDSLSGQSWRVNYLHDERNWYVNADHYSNDSDFRADLGFETKADYHKSVIGGGYRWWNENAWWNRIRLNGDYDITHNDDGELIERELEAYLSVRGAMQSYLEVGHLKRQRVGLRHDNSVLAVDGNTTLFDESSTSFYAEARPDPALFANAFVRIGDQVDFANNRLGEQFYFESRVDVNIGQHAQLRVKHIYSDLDVAGQPLFTARLSDVRLSYQFDPRQFLRLILAYNNTHRNPQNYTFDVSSRSRSLAVQLLYSYKLNPLTKFFFGIGSGSVEYQPMTELHTTEKSAFLKLSYAWQL